MGWGVHQVPLVDPAEDFGIPVWSPDRSKLLISNLNRFDASGDSLPFRPATVRPDGSTFTVLEPRNAPFEMFARPGLPTAPASCAASAAISPASSAFGPPTEETRCDSQRTPTARVMLRRTSHLTEAGSSSSGTGRGRRTAAQKNEFN